MFSYSKNIQANPVGLFDTIQQPAHGFYTVNGGTDLYQELPRQNCQFQLP